MSEITGERPSIIAKRGPTTGQVSKTYLKWRQRQLEGNLREYGLRPEEVSEKNEWGKRSQPGQAARKQLAERLAGQRKIERLERLAVRDELTGLYNRRHFNNVLAREIAEVKRGGLPLCLMIIDLDKFKTVNDQLGHLEGDEALKFIARFLEKNTRASDVVFRWGGEEFAVILPNTHLTENNRGEEVKGATLLAKRLTKEFEEEFKSFLAEKNYDFNKEGAEAGSLSLAIGQYKERESAEELVDRIDQKLKNLKNNNQRNQVAVVD